MDEAGIHHFHGHPGKGAEQTKEILHRLKFDNDTITKVTALIRWHDDNPPLEMRAVRRAIHRVGTAQYPALFALKRADILAQSSHGQREKLAYVDAYEALYHRILEQRECLCIKDLAVDGRDLLAAGVPQGRQIGETLKALLELVLEHPEYNTREYLLAQLVNLKERISGRPFS
jgi:tRNA nucleotidyltransferase (CCA-adding enzyme)